MLNLNLISHRTLWHSSGRVWRNTPSAPSSLDFGVESFQFHAGVFDAKLPIDAALFAVRLVRLGGNFSLQYGQFTDAAVAETLAREATQFTCGDIEPAPVFGGGTEVDAFE